MIRVSKTQLGGRPGFVAQWRDARGKKFCRGMNTTDEVAADETLAVIQRILNTPDLLDPNHPNHFSTPKDAYRAVFQRDPPEPPDDVEVEIQHGPARPQFVMSADGHIQPSVILPPVTARHRVRVPKMKQLLNENVDLTKRADSAESKVEALQAENLRLSRALNRHCDVNLADGVADFKRQKTDVSKKSLCTYLAALTDLQMYFGARQLKLSYDKLQEDPDSPEALRAVAAGGELKIAELRGKNFDDFLAARIDKKTGSIISEKRRAALKGELSVPYHFWVRRYELAYDAFAHTQLLTGHKATAPDSREMIRTVADLDMLLAALKEEEKHGVYWQAFVGTAVLTGADLSTLFDLKREDVILEEPTRFIMSRNKTGKQRDTPIERTLLLPIIKKYCKIMDASKPFLFPSLLDERTRARKYTAPGQWSGASAFGEVWKEVGKRCALRLQKQHKLSEAQTAFCRLGPRAWRRSAVTFMNGAGCLPQQAARWVGHSVSMADRHYLGRVERNGLVFESTAPASNAPSASPAAKPKQQKPRSMRPRGMKEAISHGEASQESTKQKTIRRRA